MCNTSRVSIASLEPSCVLPSQRAPSPGLPLSASHPAGESFVTRTKQKSFSSASRYLLGASPQPGVHGPLAVTWRLSTPHHSQSTHTHTPPTGTHLDCSLFCMFWYDLPVPWFFTVWACCTYKDTAHILPGILSESLLFPISLSPR